MKAFPLVLASMLALLSSLRAGPEEVRVASYNVENYLGPAPEEQPGARRSRPKSDAAIESIVRIVKETDPDILGVCEMGHADQFASFKERLAGAGLRYADSEYVDGPDPDRHLALLSRFPIVARHSLPDVSYELNGVPQKVKRGFLDVTVRLNSAYELRLVGVHLKSKLESGLGEALVRRHEAQLLRQHAEKILADAPETNLMLYGDFNDLKNEPAVQEIMGPRGSPMRLSDLWLKDVHGDRWTQYWKAADLYSRFDYFFVNAALAHEIVLPHSGIYRSEFWNEASDHRLIYTSIVPVNRR
jgi:endonuclease/exonuclease/phosphatase family metal-dependent hydrolase